jgi:hypothetical protein
MVVCPGRQPQIQLKVRSLDPLNFLMPQLNLLRRKVALETSEPLVRERAAGSLMTRKPAQLQSEAQRQAGNRPPRAE